MKLITPVLSILILPVIAAAQQPDAKGIEFFETKIRPVLVESCYACHSAEAEAKKKLRGGLRLDTREAVLKGGDSGPALVPGKIDKGHLLKALKYDGDVRMPPRGKLADAVIADFAKWIEMGAPDPRDGKPVVAKTIDIDGGRNWWAFKPLTTATPPAVSAGSWERTPIDQFILAKLRERKLSPNPSAGREKLIRRASYDLLGLPPTPADVEAFIKDASPNAYERLIDRLLESEHYGERWARHWLDIVRFAESGGYEFDKDRPTAHHYRDFIIKALNQDMPYDQFVRLQIAGDQLQPNYFPAVSATGFLVAGPFPGQTTSKTQELIRYNHLDDMVSTLGSALLGLSVGCARCHDHKYDPIPTQDYYRLIACLGRTDSTEAKIDLNPEKTKQARADFDRAHAPLLATQAEFEKTLPERLQKWLAAQQTAAAPWLVLDITESKGKATFKKQMDGSVLVAGKEEKAETFTFTTYTHQQGLKLLRLEGLTDPSLPANGPGRSIDGKYTAPELTLTATSLNGKGKPTPVKIKGTTSKDTATVYAFEADVGFEEGTMLTINLKFAGAGLGRPRFSISTDSAAKIDGEGTLQNPHELAALLKREKGELTAKNRAGVIRWLRTLDAAADKIYAAVEEHAKKEPQPTLASVFAATSGRGGPVSYLIRGEVERKSGIAEPGFIQVLMSEANERWTGQKAEPRIALANWVTDTEKGAGHLLARVIVNRLWQHHFGRGIVATSNDFGSQGEPPTHPELLDYLASELMRNGWKLKPIHKLIMTSAVYMQGGEVIAGNLQADSQNRLWWRYPTRRLQAEVIRDALLAVSGTLDKTMYGRGTLDGNNPRRSIYLTVKRSQMVPMMQMFDAPEAIQSIGERSTTTVPTQSLAFLNSPFVRQRAEKLAQRIRPDAKTTLLNDAIDSGYLHALSRRPTASEQAAMLAFVQRQAESYGANPRATDMALTDFCQVLLCLNEFVYVD